MNEILDQIEISVPPKSEVSAPNTRFVDSAESFGCCSRYSECSAAGACQIPDREYAKNCIYQKSLESGTTYYGKNANQFSATVYTEMLHRVEALSPQARAIFNDLLIYMREYNRAVFSCVVRNRFIEELSSVGLFTFRPLTASEFPPRKADGKPTGWKYDALASAILSDAHYGSLFENARKDQKSKKDFLILWLTEKENKGMLDRLSEPYRMATLPSENLRYAEELYRNTLFAASSDGRIYPHSVWWEDGMLSPAEMKSEEERRIKLSHGYSDEEKAALLNSI